MLIFEHKEINGVQDGAYHHVLPNMCQSLMKFALKIAPAVRRSEKTALDKQRESKQKKQDLLRNKKILAVQKEYSNALTYIDMFHSPACWRTKNDAQKAFESLRSKAARMEAIKEQIRIRVIGFGWKDHHHAWSNYGVEYHPEDLFRHLIQKIIPEQTKRGIPEKPNMELPSRKATPQLGTLTSDVEALEHHYENDKEVVIKEAVKLRETLEAGGVTDRHEKLQPPRTSVEETMIYLEMSNCGCLRKKMEKSCPMVSRSCCCSEDKEYGAHSVKCRLFT